MKLKLLYILFVTLLISNMFMIFMLVRKPHMPNHHRPNEFLLNELNFTEDQRSSFDILDEKHHMRLRKAEDKIRDSKALLFAFFEDSTINKDSLTNEIGKLEALKHKEIVSFFGAVKMICNNEQAKIFDKLIKRGLNRGRPEPRSRR